MQITVKPTTRSGAPMSIPGAGSLPANPELVALADLGAPALSGGTVNGRMITLNEIGAGTTAWKLNLNAAPYGDSEALTETLTLDHLEGEEMGVHGVRVGCEVGVVPILDVAVATSSTPPDTPPNTPH